MLTASWLLVAGCGETKPTATTSSRPAEPKPATEVKPPANGELADGDAKIPAAELQEAWHVIHIEGNKIGHVHETTREIEVEGEKLLELVSKQKMTIKRSGQTVGQYIEITSIEKPDGRLVSVGTKMVSGASMISITGRCRGGKMDLETTTSGKTVKSTIDWDPNWGGPFADRLSLERKPMKPGETRTLRSLMPGTTDVGEVQLKAIGLESTELLDEKRELMKIETVTRFGPVVISGVTWTDEAGEILRVWIGTGLPTETFRTTKEVALRESDGGAFDLNASTMVKLAKPLKDAHATKKIIYRARLKRGDPSKTFANSPSQLVEKIDEHTAEITVRALRPGEDAATQFAAPRAPASGDESPNNLIQSDDTLVALLSNQVLPEENEHWTLACGFEEFVQKLVTTTNFSQAIASAADVARERKGDCTEHAVLLAALCRARGLPARVAMGLVYSPRDEAFAYHMWNEVWIDDQWIPMDATLGRRGIGAAHLKVADSDLASASPLSALLPVIDVIGQLELEIVSVE